MSSSTALFPKEIEPKDKLIEVQISNDYNPLFNSKLFSIHI